MLRHLHRALLTAPRVAPHSGTTPAGGRRRPRQADHSSQRPSPHASLLDISKREGRPLLLSRERGIPSSRRTCAVERQAQCSHGSALRCASPARLTGGRPIARSPLSPHLPGAGRRSGALAGTAPSHTRCPWGLPSLRVTGVNPTNKVRAFPRAAGVPVYGAQGWLTAQLTSSVHRVAVSQVFEPPSEAM